MTHALQVVPRSAPALLSSIVDYAGTFPPAALSIREAVHAYAAALRDPNAWMLGRFVVSARNLPEVAEERRTIGNSLPEWRLSAIVDADSSADHDAVAEFNSAHAGTLAAVDTIECRPAGIITLDTLVDRWGSECEVYVEIDPAADLDGWFRALASRRLRGKLRTGGITAAAFPSASSVLRFIGAALATGTPFKATAGLHHPLRGRYRLTYAADAESAPMFGYVNVLLAAAALLSGAAPAQAEPLLLASGPTAISFDDDGVRYDEYRFDNQMLRRVREHLIAFGSCSFREPVDELQSLLARRSQ